MQEICQSGSEGGAKSSIFVPTPINVPPYLQLSEMHVRRGSRKPRG